MVVARVKVPKQVGRYQLGYELSPSYLGPLWAARVEGNEAAGLVMLRLVSLAHLDADTRVRLLEAAWQAMEVNDARVAPVSDVVASDGELSVVCEYVEGVTFRSLSGLVSVKRKPIPIAVALRFIVDMADGVVALHRAMAELGDEAVPLFGGLSSDSVLIGADGRASLLDVAIASAASTVESLGGTPERIAYAAPEQLEETPSADSRTDLFSMGILAWEMLSSRRLFVGSDKSVAQKVLAAKIPRLEDPARKGDQEVPKPLVQAVMRALSRDRAERFESAEAFRAALDGCGITPATPEDAAEYVTTIAEGPFARTREALSLPPRPPRPPAVTPAKPRAAAAATQMKAAVGLAKPMAAPRAVETKIPAPRGRIDAKPAAIPRVTDPRSGVMNPRGSRDTKPALPMRPSGEMKAVAAARNIEPKAEAIVAKPQEQSAPKAAEQPTAPVVQPNRDSQPVPTSPRVSIEPPKHMPVGNPIAEPAGGSWRALEPPSNRSVPPAKVRPRQNTMIGLPPPSDLRAPTPGQPPLAAASAFDASTPVAAVAAEPDPTPVKLLPSWAPSKYSFPEGEPDTAKAIQPVAPKAPVAQPDTVPPPSSSEEPTGQYTREHLKQLVEHRPSPVAPLAPVLPAEPLREREVTLPRLVTMQPTPRPLSEIHTDRPPPPEPELTPAASPAALRTAPPSPYSLAPPAAPQEARAAAPLPPAFAHAAPVHIGAPPAARIEPSPLGTAPSFAPPARSVPAGGNNAAFAPAASPARGTERPAFSRPPPATAAASYVPSQIGAPLIHDPRANRAGPALASASPHFARGIVFGVIGSLALVAVSTTVALFFMRGREAAPTDEPSASDTAAEHRSAVTRSESAAAAPAPTTPMVAAGEPARSPSASGAAAPATAALPPSAATAEPSSEAAEPGGPGAGSSASARAATEAPATHLHVAAPRAARPARKAATPKKKKFVPEDI